MQQRGLLLMQSGEIHTARCPPLPRQPVCSAPSRSRQVIRKIDVEKAGCFSDTDKLVIHANIHRKCGSLLALTDRLKALMGDLLGELAELAETGARVRERHTRFFERRQRAATTLCRARDPGAACCSPRSALFGGHVLK